MVRSVPRFAFGFEDGARYLLQIEPPVGVDRRGSVLCIQPLSEEATLSRRVLAAMATRMASRGWTVFIPDLYGVGDSAGETESITLAIWRSDLTEMALRIDRREFAVPDRPVSSGPTQEATGRRLVVWGIRLGCFLAVDLIARREDAEDSLLLWQPGAHATGNAARLIGPAAVGSKGRDGTAEDSGDGLTSVNGYRYRRTLLDDLSALDCEPPPLEPPPLDCRQRPVMMIHMGRLLSPTAGAADGRPAAPPALMDLADRWRKAGSRVEIRLARSEPFWSSIEPVLPEEAFAASEAFLSTL